MKERFQKARTFQEFLEENQKAKHPWADFHARARVPEETLERWKELKGQWRLLALVEGWCGDAANTIPVLARLAEVLPEVELRVLYRDENPDLMDLHLTAGSRAIPVVMVLDDEFREVGWWGPRPAPLQEIFDRDLRPLTPAERYPKLRAWYARDRGRTTLDEILERIPVAV